MNRWDCPVCGKSDAYEDIYDFCDVCGWQEDSVQKRNPGWDVGANPVSLNEARAKWSRGEGFKARCQHPGQING
jgi:hypothetical protein